MQCPKCNHEQTSTDICDACGIVFEKYYKRQKELKEAQDSLPDNKPGQKEPLNIKPLIYGIVGLAFCLGLFLIFPSNDEIENTDKTTVTLEAKSVDHGIAWQLNDAYPPKNDIEKARNSTVVIESAWGFGSGFFIDADCHIITNRHVVEFSEEQTELFHEQLNSVKQIIDNEKQNIDLIERQFKDYEAELIRREEELSEARAYYEDSIHRLDQRQVEKLRRSLERAERDIAYMKNRIDVGKMNNKLEERKEILRKAIAKYDEYNSKLEDMEYGIFRDEFKIKLIDESEYIVKGKKLSEKYDLALLSLTSSGCPYIEVSDEADLEQGMRVFTIGNPVGLMYSVTSGIISGNRELEGNRYIQTDAPINLGNSGGPLVDSNGKVVGVNTAILQDTEGIGFAIPIQTVLDEFGDYIKPN